MLGNFHSLPMSNQRSLEECLQAHCLHLAASNISQALAKNGVGSSLGCWWKMHEANVWLNLQHPTAGVHFPCGTWSGFCFQLVSQGKKPQRLSATLFTSTWPPFSQAPATIFNGSWCSLWAISTRVCALSSSFHSSSLPPVLLPLFQGWWHNTLPNNSILCPPPSATIITVAAVIQPAHCTMSPATARSVRPSSRPKSLPPATSGRQKKPMNCP